MENKGSVIDDILNDKIRYIEYRYAKESSFIGILANYALNKEKNKIKGKFEDINLEKLWSLMVDEFQELHSEIFNKENIEFERVLEEIADAAASLTGILVKVLKLHQEAKK